jgi:hypothetical protein
MIKIMEIEMANIAVLMSPKAPLVIAMQLKFVEIFHARHMVEHKPRFTRRLQSSGLKLSMSIMLTRPCIGSLVTK